MIVVVSVGAYIKSDEIFKYGLEYYLFLFIESEIGLVRRACDLRWSVKFSATEREKHLNVKLLTFLITSSILSLSRISP